MSDKKRSAIIAGLVSLNGGEGCLDTESLNIYEVIKNTLDHSVKTYGKYEVSQLLKFCSDLYNIWEGFLTDDEKQDYRLAISWLIDFYEMITDESETPTEEQPDFRYSCQDYYELIKKISGMREIEREQAFGEPDFQKLLIAYNYFTLSDKLKKWEDKQNAIELYEKVKIKSTGEFGWVTKINKDLYTVLTFDGSCKEIQKNNLAKTGYFNIVLKDMFKDIAEEIRLDGQL